MKMDNISFTMSDTQYQELMHMLNNLPPMKVSFLFAYKKKGS